MTQCWQGFLDKINGRQAAGLAIHDAAKETLIFAAQSRSIWSCLKDCFSELFKFDPGCPACALVDHILIRSDADKRFAAFS